MASRQHPDMSTPAASSLTGGINVRPFITHYILPVIGVVLLLLIVLSHGFGLFGNIGGGYDMEAFGARTPFRYRGSFARDFNDLNDLQLISAQRIGITPLKNREEAKSGLGRLTEITSTSHYTLDNLSHSIPYLVPPAARLLSDIGEEFTTTLRSLNLPEYRPIVTSVTRTMEDIRSLRKGNVNSTENSTHLYATTFDISWRRFHKVDPDDPRDITADELKHLLADVLSKYRKAGRCYVKHERLQACFHITTAN